jgi:hypothetical protein
MNTPGEYNPPINTFYTQISVPSGINVAVLIGKDGCYFKKMTEKSGAQYIWYDTERNVVEVWGPEYTLSLALHFLKKRFNQLMTQNMCVESTLVDETAGVV